MIRKFYSIFFKAFGYILVIICVFLVAAVIFVLKETFETKLITAVVLVLCCGVPAAISFRFSALVRYVKVKIKMESIAKAETEKQHKAKTAEYAYKLRKLKTLLKEGMITETEFKQKKNALLYQPEPVKKEITTPRGDSDKLDLIKYLLDERLITRNEYEQKRNEIINGLKIIGPTIQDLAFTSKDDVNEKDKETIVELESETFAYEQSEELTIDSESEKDDSSDLESYEQNEDLSLKLGLESDDLVEPENNQQEKQDLIDSKKQDKKDEDNDIDEDLDDGFVIEL